MQHVYLLPCSNEGLAKFVDFHQNPKNHEFYRHFPPFFEWVRDVNFLQSVQSSMLELRLGTEIVGFASVTQVNNQAKSLCAGVVIDHAKKHEILLTGLPQFFDYVFKEKGFHRIELRVLPHRTKLIQGLTDLGFEVEGTLKDSCRCNGSYFDEVVLSIREHTRKI